MRITEIPYEQTTYFFKTVLDYLSGNPALQPFYDRHFDISDIEHWIQQKADFSLERKKLLVDALQKQYKGFKISAETQANIDKLLAHNTFTITTGHQINLFTGPLYFIYKIVSCILLTKELNSAYPAYHFVPVFWMNTEDHDIAEINHINLFGKQLAIETDYKGVSGAYDLEGIDKVLEKLKSILGDNEQAQKITDNLEKHYLQQPNWAAATRSFVNELFGEYGLLILDQADAQLKGSVQDLFESELTEHKLFNTAKNSSEQLQNEGYKAQALPRAINLFYHFDERRERIVYQVDKGHYLINNTELVFSEKEILEELRVHPNRFSTNVLSRPLYQEMVLPNLAYIGGGGELAYWLQLKMAFEQFDIPFPALILRNSVFWVDKAAQKKLEQLQLKAEDLFQDTELLIKHYVLSNSTEELSADESKQLVQDAYALLKSQAGAIDKSLEKAIEAEATKHLNAMNKLEKRMLKAQKAKFETDIEKIRKLKNRLFPEGKLQERYDNFLAYWLKYNDGFINALMNNLNPLSGQFTIIEE